MKKILFSTILLLISTISFSQKLTPIKWNISPSKDEVKIGDVVEIRFEATIEHDWYLYSNDFSPELGPKLTLIEIKPNDGFELVGKPTAVGQKRKFDDLWGGEYSYFKEKGLFVQKVKILKNKPTIEGLIDYQVCTDKDGRCIPLKEKFNINQIKIISSGGVQTSVPATNAVVAAQSPAEPEKKNAEPAALIQPAKVQAVKEEKSILASVAAAILPASKPDSAVETPVIQAEKPVITEVSSAISNSPSTENVENQSIWSFLALAFSLGFASIFMPCIYPIMPMTINFFIKQKDGKRKAVVYGLFIMLIFGGTGLVTMAFGAPFLNFLSTHWAPNLVFFLIFILFGASMLGAFEIVLPSSMVNKIDAAADRSDWIGIFFMALTLVVVSFSCTIPFVGSLLILSAKGEILRPLYGMLAFGLPFALVFGGLAFFPSVLKTLPKSGGWLGELKVVFALLEFALAIKFISNIDLTYHFNALSRNLFLYIWIFFFALIALYIFGIIRLPSDEKVKKYNISRVFFGTAAAAFAIYLATGLNAKPLTLLQGFLPPLEYGQPKALVANGLKREMAHGLQGYADYDDAIAAAKESGKPLLIDFTGYACANCRKMEENIWPNEEVNKLMKENFELASLYVDDKKILPADKQYISKYDDEKKISVGDKNLDIEITKFNNNAQPLYCIVDANGKLIVQPFSYTNKPEEFLKFLNSGLKK